MTWVAPCRGRLTSDYGPRVAPTAGATTWHRGVDIAPPVRGQAELVSVHSVGPGRVRAVGRDAERGTWAVIFHDDGSATTYQHLASRVVATGMLVAAGSTIGAMGASGTGAGVHLHLEAFPDADSWVQRGTSWRSAAAMNPELYLAARGVNLRAAIAVAHPVTRVDEPPSVPNVPPLPTPITSTTREVDDMDRTIRLVYVKTVCALPGDLEVLWWATEIATGRQSFAALENELKRDGRYQVAAAMGSEEARNARRLQLMATLAGS